MPYEAVATSNTPALIVYLLDMSGSMEHALGGVAKIEHVNDAVFRLITTLIRRASKGDIISPRYRIAMFGYSDGVADMLGGVKTIDVVAKRGRPVLKAKGQTNTYLAFQRAREVVEKELLTLPKGSPAPMICHLTDGQANTEDPEPVAKQIMGMGNADGAVLIENVFVAPNLTHQPIGDPEQWPGLTDRAALSDDYARKLFDMSSPLPRSYTRILSDSGYASIQPGARMLIPATNQDLIELAFVMSGSTPTTPEPAAGPAATYQPPRGGDTVDRGAGLR